MNINNIDYKTNIITFKANEFMPKPDSYAKKQKFPVKGIKPKTDLYIPNNVKLKQKPFVSWPHGVGIVHSLTIFADKTGTIMTRLIEQERPAMGGVKTIEAPAGKYADADPAETAVKGARREVMEETGLKPKKVLRLTSEPMATSPGITNELKDFVLVLAQDKGGERKLTEAEKAQKAIYIDVPLTTITDTTKFLKWQKQLKKKGQIIGVDISTLKGLINGNPKVKKLIKTLLKGGV